ncbi:MAG: carbon monoxide dehydrogenase [Pseudorhodobacter sp. PARRP1]|nr:MAG: carbon monoxide dehydrogenase [Pseudorhodobacter sp. PARRP1]
MTAAPKHQGRFGESVTRVEDRRLVTGQGRFIDDLVLAGMLHMAIVRSDRAHARIVSVDVRAALEADGVVAVLTGVDFAASGWGDIPCESMPPAITKGKWVRTPFPSLPADRVMAMGDPVAVVLAETRKQAQDACELVEIELEDLAVVASMEAAIADNAPQLYPDAPGNLCFSAELGDALKTEAAFAQAAHVITLQTRQPRLAHASMEMRGSVGVFDRRLGRYELTTSTQNPHSVRRLLAEAVLKVPAHRVRVSAGDVGGAFGLKGRLYPEDVLVLWAAERTGRPVKWVPSRSEAFLSDFQGRDHMASGEMAFDAEGHILGLRATTRHNLGCRLGPATGVSPFLSARMLAGPYVLPAAHVRVQGVFSNTRSTTSYRGAGRPEATYFLERMLDKAARQLGLTPVEIRRRNLIPAAAMPFKTALLDTYDCGDFPGVFEKALTLADWDGFAARKAVSAINGLLRGQGISYFVEVSALSNERMSVQFDPTGHATVLAGTFAHGQGHHTLYTQMLHDWLGLRYEDISVVDGDTDIIPYGGGTYASRSVTVGGSALRRACDQIIVKATAIAANLLEADPAQISFAEGIFTVQGSNKALSLSEVARAAYRVLGHPGALGVGLEAVGTYTAQPQNYPNGCHIAEVEIDPDFGTVRLVAYAAVDDVGVAVNPLLLEGQLIGSTAMGVGQALMERVVYDEAGQQLTAAFTEYAMPRAEDMPLIISALHNTPTKTNPIGVKGGAEVGTIAAPPAIVQAIEDALGFVPEPALTMPVTAAQVLRAIHREKRTEEETK